MSRFWASVLIDQARAHTSRSMAPPSISPHSMAPPWNARWKKAPPLSWQSHLSFIPRNKSNISRFGAKLCPAIRFCSWTGNSSDAFSFVYRSLATPATHKGIEPSRPLRGVWVLVDRDLGAYAAELPKLTPPE